MDGRGGHDGGGEEPGAVEIATSITKLQEAEMTFGPIAADGQRCGDCEGRAMVPGSLAPTGRAASMLAADGTTHMTRAPVRAQPAKR